MTVIFLCSIFAALRRIRHAEQYAPLSSFYQAAADACLSDGGRRANRPPSLPERGVFVHRDSDWDGAVLVRALSPRPTRRGRPDQAAQPAVGSPTAASTLPWQRLLHPPDNADTENISHLSHLTHRTAGETKLWRARHTPARSRRSRNCYVDCMSHPLSVEPAVTSASQQSPR